MKKQRFSFAIPTSFPKSFNGVEDELNKVIEKIQNEGDSLPKEFRYVK